MSIDVGSATVRKAKSVGTGSAQTRRISLELMDKTQSTVIGQASTMRPSEWLTPVSGSRHALLSSRLCGLASDSGEAACLVITGSVGTSPASSGPHHSKAVWRRVRACADYHGALPSPSIILRAESRCNCVKPEIQSDVRQQTIKVISLFISFLGDL